MSKERIAEQGQPVQTVQTETPPSIFTRRKLLGLFGLGGVATALLSACGPDQRGSVNVKGKAAGIDFDFNVTLETPVAGVPQPTAPTATVEAKTNVMTLPKPAGWSEEPTLNVVQATNVPSFPKTRAEAAATFGVDGSTRDPKRWEQTAEGEGWHLSEAQEVDGTKDALNINPRGYLTEGYYDTKPGRNPFAWASIDVDGNIPAQGGTVWNEKGGREKAVNLQSKMAIPVWQDDAGVATQKPAVIIAP